MLRENFKIKLPNHRNSIMLLTIDEFQAKYHPDIRRETIAYACTKNWIDYIKPGRERFILLTKKTKDYIPQKHISRNKKTG